MTEKQVKVLFASIVDAFAETPFAGNPAGVVLDADGLTESEMQLVAREINHSETAFVVGKDLPDADFHVRFFTPVTEVDLCGHATIAAFFLLAKEGRIRKGGDTTLVRQKTKAGILPLRIEYGEKGIARVMMRQAPPQFRAPQIDGGRLSRLLRLKPTDLCEVLPLEQAYTGLWHLIVPLKTRAAVDGARPDFSSLGEVNREIGAITTHLFTLETNNTNASIYCRDFAPAVGVNEDPVTGTACGAMMAYLVRHRMFSFNGSTNTAIAEQGFSVKRPGTVYLEAIGHDPVREIWVGGAAVGVARIEMAF